MRILLAQNSLYYPSHGGGDKSNRLLMEALAARGHAGRVVARTGAFGPAEQERLLNELAARTVPVLSSDSGVVRFEHQGVEVHVATSHPNLRAYFSEQIEAFDPDVILASTDDAAQLLLEAALRAERARVVYLARATLALPFGPDCAFPSEAKTAVLRQVDGAVGVSQYVADYMRRWGGIDAVHVPISLLDPGPYPDVGRFDNKFVTLVNPCAVKGIIIFTALAERMPEVAFAAVPTWGANESDLAALRRHPNIRILEPVDQIDRILERTRVLLVPSLWAEARSRIVVEAMLHGVPVIASNVGGIPEAKLGVDYLLPVRSIEHYQPRLDERMVPVADVPEQDIAPWLDALQRLVTDRAHWEALSRASRAAALAYAEAVTIVPFEQYLEKTRWGRRLRLPGRAAAPPEAKAASPLDRLSPEKRALLALRLKQKSASGPAGNPWFPKADAASAAQARLFCFPHAGGGAAVFRGWEEGLPPEILVCPARLPGRESRRQETPIDRMDQLIDALARAIEPLLDRPFAFFGHSMGAAVAFELARCLRRDDKPLPVCLFVSGARAPQFRLGHVPPPEPSEREFLEQLRRLEGVPKEILDHEELLKLILPALKADAALYRNYAYLPEPPLPCPIHAYGGEQDPNVHREHLEAWREQTTAGFRLRMFPGGHFFMESDRSRLLAALSEQVQSMFR